MARVKIEGIIDYLGNDMRKALRDAVEEVVPNTQFDEYELFRTFKRKVNRKCSTWERVPDRFIEND